MNTSPQRVNLELIQKLEEKLRDENLAEEERNKIIEILDSDWVDFDTYSFKVFILNLEFN